jgi:hypothetical protein
MQIAVPTSQETCHFSATKICRLMFRKKLYVYCDNQQKHRNVMRSDACSNDWALNWDTDRPVCIVPSEATFWLI